MSWERKVVESSNLLKLFFKFFKVFGDKTEQKIFRPECPFNYMKDLVGNCKQIDVIKITFRFMFSKILHPAVLRIQTA